MRNIQTDIDRLDGRWDKRELHRDLRRQWERLLHRARFLEPRERAFLELVVEQQGRISQLSRLTRRSPAAIRRHLGDISRRLTRPELCAVVEHPDTFTPFEKACIREHLVRKHSLTSAANDLNTTVYTLRKTLIAARAKAQRLYPHRAASVVQQRQTQRPST
ncbi:MAG: hypothetical protein GXY41_06615 [Phycisphaerae bacterium]|nr:hypothetical protein [Phycisphaerae bacterium]